jgi:hypothetical protein
MGQLYVPDKSWLICSDGMSMQQLKVTSQTTIKVAGGLLAATIKDRTGGNFICGKMLVAGAIAGAAIAAIMVSTGGLGFIAAAAVIAGSAVGGAVAGAAVGTLLSMIPCLCALFMMPNDWIGCHPKVLLEKKQALLENATLMCMLGGKIEIHIFQEFANARLSEIRKNILMEAGIQALKVTAFLRFPKIFIFGNLAVDIALYFYTGKGAGALKAGKFVFDNPNAALKINEDKSGSLLLTQNTTRFTVSLSQNSDDVRNDKGDSIQYSDWEGDHSNLLENENHFKETGAVNEGTQSNAYRHTLWQAEITEEFGEDNAVKAGNAHELNPRVPYKEEGYNNLEEADSYIDQRNNEIGRTIGTQNPNTSQNILADKVLDYYYQNGLWELEKNGDKYFPVKRTLPQEQYDELKQAVATMNRYGYLENALETRLTNSPNDKPPGFGVSEDKVNWFKKIPITKY